ncbi:hypothetical protein EDF57_103548 [Novosphingobium sp. PhB55]|uniref:hypothetical protein n=1 Tax=Novosphingobium sp. PhB55 TaxID=2485106 RepID=UPI001066A8E2|nr:hypothetical protein [Novosphingobium sp. PhB55]TDW65364.1 hypothetical protein EDF57_103548 [Novosphingobium sp. PhB55]
MQWCILRTAPSRTLPLAAALEAAGYRAWTPQETRTVRVGHARVPKAISAPMMPTIVFAEYERLPLLVALSRMPSPTCSVWDDTMQCYVQRAVPNFHVFRHADLYPRVADRALDAVRLAEQRERPRDTARTFATGTAVTFADAGFEGLMGRVAGMQGRYALVDFPGFSVPVKISAHSLLPARVAA